MSSLVFQVLAPALILGTSILPNVKGKPSAYIPPPMYPYTLSYKLGEFQGELYYGANVGTVVAAKGTLGHEKYHPLFIGVEVRKTATGKAANPFQRRNNIDDQSDKNSTRTITHGMEVVVMGTTMFLVSGDGSILVQRNNEEHSLHSLIYFSVVLVRKDNGEIRSNPLSFVVEIIANPNDHQHNKNAITAGILVLLILFIGGLTLAAINCKNCRSRQNTDDQKSTSSGSNEDDIGMDWKDHYHIKAEDSIIMGKDCGSQSEAIPRDGKKGRAPLVRVDSSLRWLKLHDQDERDCGQVNLPTISEMCEETSFHQGPGKAVNEAYNESVSGSFTFVNGNSLHMSDDQSKSILKKPGRSTRHSHIAKHLKP